MSNTHASSGSRTRVNLTVPKQMVEEAKALGLNLSGAAEAGIAQALKRAKEEAWRKKNAAAIEAYNTRVREQGLLLPPLWMQRDGAV